MSISKPIIKRYALVSLSAMALLSPSLFAEGITVDNLDPSVIKNGIWSVSGGANPYGQNSEYAPEATASIQWPISVPSSGRYEAQAHWTEWANRTSQANYLISNGVVSDTITVDQKQRGGQWVTLGDYELIAGDLNVTLTNGNGGTLSGDAVRIVGPLNPVVGGNPIVVDNDDATVTRQGGWAPSSGANPYDGASEFTTIGTFGWEATLPDAGQYIVEAYWTYYNNRTDQAAYEIQHAGGVDTVTVDQKENAGEWVELGVYDFNAGPANILLTNAAGAGTLSADAVRYIPTDGDPVEPGPEILYFDNQSSNVEREGYWAKSGGANPYDGHSEYSTNGEFTWNITILDDSEVDAYDFQVYWTGYSNRTTNAVYNITGSYDDGIYGPPGTRYSYRVDVDQTQNAGEWVSLGTYSLAEAQVSVRNESGGTLSADAVRLIPLKRSDDSFHGLESISKECSISDSNHAGDHIEVVEADDQSITLNILGTGESLLINPASELTDLPLYRGYFIRENRELWYSINDNRQVIISWLDKHLRFLEGGANPYENTRYVLHTKVFDLNSGEIKTHMRELGKHYQMNIRTRTFCDDSFIHLDTHAINFGTGAIYDTRMHSLNPNFMPLQELELQYDNGPYFFEPFNPFRI